MLRLLWFGRGIFRMNSSTKKVAICIKNLSKSYVEGGEPHSILRKASAEIYDGEMVALLGRSGSGKSTLLNLISGIDVPDDGEVAIGDNVITDMSEQRRTLFRREHVGFVYQFFNLIPTLDVMENLKLVMELNSENDIMTRCTELLNAVGLEDRANAYPDALSGGEQQRVAIARALVHKPGVLLADEPTGNLDETTSDEIWELIDRLVRPSGGTILLATHSLAAAKRCDRVLELTEGKLHDITGALS